METFDRCFDLLIDNEGGYVNDPNDPGGETMWGVTEEVAREHGYMGPMKEMPQMIAMGIYQKRYWLPWMDNAPMPLAFELFDCAVNCGAGTAAKLLQKTLGVAQDGVVGPKTMAAASAATPAALWASYISARLDYYTRLPGWKHYSAGWTRRIANNLLTGSQMVEGH